MHSFQPFPLEELEFNPFKTIGQDWGLVSAGTKDAASHSARIARRRACTMSSRGIAGPVPSPCSGIRGT